MDGTLRRFFFEESLANFCERVSCLPLAAQADIGTIGPMMTSLTLHL
jgi:hypothetical protein